MAGMPLTCLCAALKARLARLRAAWQSMDQGILCPEPPCCLHAVERMFGYAAAVRQMLIIH